MIEFGKFEANKGRWDLSARWAWTVVILLWLFCSAMLISAASGNILHGTFNDADDAMRLTEVRDWMAGQSWFDVTQYRSQVPGGAPMHWSRLVDVPIATLITMGSWFLPASQAERMATVAEPLLIFLLLCITLYRLTVEICVSRLAGMLSTAWLAVSIGILVQFSPTRIDHHSWQITLGALGVLFMIQALKGREGRAAFAGIAVALSLTVAIEGLPLAAAIGGVFALEHWRRGGTGRLVSTYLITLTAGSALLLLATLGWPRMAVLWCDALSPAYLFPFATATLMLVGLLRLLPQDRGAMRLFTLGVAGAAAVLALRLGSPQCAAGPFSTLDPLVYKLWYINVAEGRPLWFQIRDCWILLLSPSLLGIVGAIAAIRLDDAGRRDIWIASLIVQCLTFLVSVMVMRAMGLAHLVSIPANVWLFLHIFVATRRLSTPGARIAAGALSLLATPVGMQALIVACLPTSDDGSSNLKVAKRRAQCLNPVTLRGLAALPRSTVFAPLDISPHLLVYTPHKVIATGHHRAREGMKTVISAFTASPDEARRIIATTPATYLALCPYENEVLTYTQYNPHSLMAGLKAGRIPAWLQRVPMRKGETIRVYRILPYKMARLQPGVKAIATPFIQ